MFTEGGGIATCGVWGGETTRHIATLPTWVEERSCSLSFAESGRYGRGVVGGSKFQLGGPVSMTNGFLENRLIEMV